MRFLVVLVSAALLLAPAAFASERHPTMNELENEVMCPVCNTTLAESNSDAAKAIEREIQDKIRAGWTKSQIKDFLVQQYGESILAAPPKHGFNLLAWVLPLAGIGVAAVILGIAAWSWTRGRAEPEPLALQSSNGQGPIDPELDRRVDEELSRLE
jgi:cytochrome c-type biogenesis protein CcmH